MDIFILLLIVVLISLLPVNNNYLNVKSTNGLKGFLALGIVFHHLSQWVTTGVEFSNFNYMGTYTVSAFFFLSGYGLYIQNERKEGYLDNFLVKRLSRVIVPVIFVSGIYIVYFISNKYVITINYFINLFVKGSTIIANGWFVDIIILLYVCFYVSFKIFSNRTIAILVNTILIVGYIILATKLGYDFWWYNSSLPFALGLIWAKYNKEIDKVLSDYYFICIILVTCLLFISHQYSFILKKLSLVDDYSYGFAANIDNIIFTVFFILIVRKIDFSNKYLLFLGKISFELYMIHGLVISIFGKYFVTSRLNDIIFTILVLSVSIILAWIINLIIGKISIKDCPRNYKFF